MTYDEAIKMAAELAVERTYDPGNDFVSSVSLPTLRDGVYYCDVFEGTLKVAETSVDEELAGTCRTVGQTSEHTFVDWS